MDRAWTHKRGSEFSPWESIMEARHEKKGIRESSGLARIGDTWLAQGSHVGGLACGTSDMDMRLGAGGVSVTLG